MLLYPMFAMVMLTFFVGLYMLYTRVQAIRTGKMDGRYFKTFNTGEPTREVLQAGRHFSNLFEVPVLFYVGCLAAMILSFTGFWAQFWAWLFVASRIIHAVIHLGNNKLIPRMSAYFLGFFAVIALWVHLVLTYAAVNQ